MKTIQSNIGTRTPVVLLTLILAACAVPMPAKQVEIGNGTLNVARTALAGGNPRMALTVTNAVLKSDPHDVEALIERGDADFSLNDCTGATASYHAALAVAPRAAAAQLGLGRCALQTDPRTAAADFTRATQDAPASFIAFNDLGMAQAEQSNFPAAIAAFRSALAINPSMQAANVNLGMALALGGHPDQAETILGPLARSPASTPMIRADYATALTLAGHSGAALHTLLADMPAVEAQAMVEQMSKLGRLSADAAKPTAAVS